MAALVLTQAVAGCDVTVETDVSAAEADSTIRLLHGHHLGAFKRPHPRASGRATFDVAVLPREAAEAVSVLRSAGTIDLPSEVAQHLDRRKPIPTITVEQEQVAAVSARELERVLALWDGVVSTRVRITPAGTARPLGSPPAPAQATVVIKHQPGRAPTAITVRTLVGHAVPAIRPEDVFVVLLEARHTAPSPLVQLGPIAVTRGGAEILRLGLIATLSLLALCAVLLAWTRVRSKHATTPERS